MSPLSELTKQERIVLELVARGWRNDRIANELFLSRRTVETHLSHIYDKLGVSSRTEAAIIALQAGAVGATIGRSSDDRTDRNHYA